MGLFSTYFHQSPIIILVSCFIPKTHPSTAFSPATDGHRPLLPLFAGAQRGAVPEDVPPQPPPLHGLQDLAGALPGGRGQLPGTGALRGVMAHGATDVEMAAGKYGGLLIRIRCKLFTSYVSQFHYNICNSIYIYNLKLHIYIYIYKYIVYIYVCISNNINQYSCSWHLQVGRKEFLVPLVINARIR